MFFLCSVNFIIKPISGDLKIITLLIHSYYIVIFCAIILSRKYMQIKNVKQTFLIFLSLIILSLAFYSYASESSSSNKNIFLDSDQDGLSDEEEKSYGTDPNNSDTDGDSYSDGVEIKTGYDPLKPAPGDKITRENKPVIIDPSPAVLGATDEKNFTQEISDKVSQIIEEKQSSSDLLNVSGGTNSNATSSPSLTVEELQNLIDEVVDENSLKADLLPEVSINDIQIVRQNYGKLSETERKDREKEDFVKYISSVFYIVSSNSPLPISSGSDYNSILQSLKETINRAISTRNSSNLDDLAKSGENMLTQMKDVEVPEKLADMHIQALRLAMSAANMKNYIKKSNNDPVGDLVNYTKLTNFVNELTVFGEEASKKAQEYGISYDDDLKQRLKTQGVILPESNASTSSQ